MSDGQLTDAPVAVHDVHGAPVGEPRNGQPYHPAQGVLIVERSEEDLPRLREEREPVAGAFGLLSSGALELEQARSLGLACELFADVQHEPHQAQRIGPQQGESDQDGDADAVRAEQFILEWHRAPRLAQLLHGPVEPPEEFGRRDDSPAKPIGPQVVPRASDQFEERVLLVSQLQVWAESGAARMPLSTTEYSGTVSPDASAALTLLGAVDFFQP